MPDEVAEQSATVEAGAEETVVGAPEGVADVAVEAVAGDSGAVAEAPVSFDLTSDDGIRAAREANPNFSGYLQKLEADARNAARQQFEAEQRREKGTVETAQAFTDWVADQLANGVSKEDINKQVPSYVKANHDNLRMEYAKALLTQAAEADETAKGMLESLTGDPDEAIRVSQVALNAAITRARAEERAAVTAELEAGYAAKLAAELSAQQLEAKTAEIQNPPNVSGSPAGTGTVTWDSIDKQYTDSQWLNLPAAERSRLTQLADQARLVGVN